VGEEQDFVRLSFIKKRYSLHGGAERYLQTLIECLKKSGHEIHVFANEWTAAEGVVFHRVPIMALGSMLSTITFNVNAKKAIARGVAPDCVISFERTTCQDVYRAGDGCHREWLSLRGSVEPWWKRASFRVNPLHLTLLSIEKKLFGRTELIIANSNMVKRQIMNHYGLPAERIRVIYNGVDLSRFSPDNRMRWREQTRNGLSIPKERKVLLFVGSGFERKGLSTLFTALSVLQKTKKGSSADVRLLVVGKGNEAKFLALAAASGVGDRVIFTGPQTNVERYYAAADIFVLPTLYDPFSNSTLEALASGLPAITTAQNGASEIIDEGVDGFTVSDALDVDGLAGKIGRALSDYSVMGGSARRKAEMFPIEKAVEEFTDLINAFVRNSAESGSVRKKMPQQL
jgi:UDP-glucose:(heptosyl)LPS alpha-1,3-glucosyltransferase